MNNKQDGKENKDKLRVYEYAKSVNMSSKEIITILKRLDLPVNNHMSVMENEMVSKVEGFFREIKENAAVKKSNAEPSASKVKTVNTTNADSAQDKKQTIDEKRQGTMNSINMSDNQKENKDHNLTNQHNLIKQLVIKSLEQGKADHKVVKVKAVTVHSMAIVHKAVQIRKEPLASKKIAALKVIMVAIVHKVVLDLLVPVHKAEIVHKVVPSLLVPVHRADKTVVLHQLHLLKHLNHASRTADLLEKSVIIAMETKVSIAINAMKTVDQIQTLKTEITKVVMEEINSHRVKKLTIHRRKSLFAVH